MALWCASQPSSDGGLHPVANRGGNLSWHHTKSARHRKVFFMKTKAPIGTTARTGERCPESGVWQVVGTPSTTAPIAEHNVMPPYNGMAVTWRLIRYA